MFFSAWERDFKNSKAKFIIFGFLYMLLSFCLSIHPIHCKCQLLVLMNIVLKSLPAFMLVGQRRTVFFCLFILHQIFLFIILLLLMRFPFFFFLRNSAEKKNEEICSEGRRREERWRWATISGPHLPESTRRAWVSTGRP